MARGAQCDLHLEAHEVLQRHAALGAVAAHRGFDRGGDGRLHCAPWERQPARRHGGWSCGRAAYAYRPARRPRAAAPPTAWVGPRSARRRALIAQSARTTQLSPSPARRMRCGPGSAGAASTWGAVAGRRAARAASRAGRVALRAGDRGAHATGCQLSLRGSQHAPRPSTSSAELRGRCVSMRVRPPRADHLADGCSATGSARSMGNLPPTCGPDTAAEWRGIQICGSAAAAPSPLHPYDFPPHGADAWGWRSAHPPFA
jgi:hypothetical protein